MAASLTVLNWWVGNLYKIEDKKIHSYVISGLRRIWRWSRERRDCLRLSQVKNAKGAKYRCAGCRRLFAGDNVTVDHINPVVNPLCGFEGYDTFCARLFVPISLLQTLCKLKCHKEKTASENKVRLEARKKLLQKG
jgi:5-methylcytosine-specific restriction endonuclease McrA